ncbi:MAG: hypothetical protein ABJK11_16075 [Balneola sp.]
MSVEKQYPKALELRALEQKITSELNLHGFILSRTIWGTSICSDEVNNSFNIFSRLFAGPGPFRFGGISGLPFTGKTGVLAFASHFPEKGGAFILYGPHIGVSKEGKTGEILRQRQDSNSTCCGSLIAGLSAIQNPATIGEETSSDYQQAQVVKMLNAKRNDILSADDQIKEVTEKAYLSIHKGLKDLIDDCRDAMEGKKLYLLGGIVINTDWDKEDYFDIRNSEVIDFT